MPLLSKQWQCLWWNCRAQPMNSHFPPFSNYFSNVFFSRERTNTSYRLPNASLALDEYAVHNVTRLHANRYIRRRWQRKRKSIVKHRLLTFNRTEDLRLKLHKICISINISATQFASPMKEQRTTRQWSKQNVKCHDHITYSMHANLPISTWNLFTKLYLTRTETSTAISIH